MIAYLNGAFLPAAEARISPFDRGFLFGDGIYEATVVFDGKPVALDLHLERMSRGLSEIGISNPHSMEEWRQLINALIEQNGGGNLGIYIQVTRGTEARRFHGFPTDTPPTVFCLAQAMPPLPDLDPGAKLPELRVCSVPDLRWQRCHIKSTSLLGNVLSFQESYSRGLDETIMYNERNELTEASASNVFIVRDGVVATPPLDHQILPGIARHLVIEALRADGSIGVEERVVTMAEVREADEIWLTSSGKHLLPVVELDGSTVVSRGELVWPKARRLYMQTMAAAN